MRHHRRCVFLATVAGLVLSRTPAPAAEQTAALPNEFFAMDTALYSPTKRAPVTEADVAKLAELGYTGLGPMIGGMGGWAGLPQLLAWLDAKHLKLYAIYTGANIEEGEYSYDPGFKESLHLLKGRGTVLWMTIRSKSKPSDPAAFELAVKMVGEAADLAAAQGLRVALYPHVNSFCERMADTVRLAEKTGRKNVGVTLNLCHWLRADGPDSLHEVVKLAMPHLMIVSINGADRDGRNWLQPLDSGTFDVAGFLRELYSAGYSGPIGLQGFSVGKTVPPYENLTRSMAAWRRLSEAAAKPPAAPKATMAN